MVQPRQGGSSSRGERCGRAAGFTLIELLVSMGNIPTLGGWAGDAWLWDLDRAVRDIFVEQLGIPRATFYCPSFREHNRDAHWNFVWDELEFTTKERRERKESLPDL